MSATFYFQTRCEDFGDYTKYKRPVSFYRAYWYYCGLYGAYHWLAAIQYLLTSVTLKDTYAEV